jgi:hypothetical protein
LVTRTTGFCTSTNVAVTIVFDAIRNGTALFADITGTPSTVTSQFVNMYPAPFVVVSVSFFPISNICPLIAPLIFPLPTTFNPNGTGTT